MGKERRKRNRLRKNRYFLIELRVEKRRMYVTHGNEHPPYNV
jgi:hypothetical protein